VSLVPTRRAATWDLGRDGVIRGNDPLVKDVPADICDTCGEPYFDEQVTQRLLDLAREAAAAGVVVDVRRYVAA